MGAWLLALLLAVQDPASAPSSVQERPFRFVQGTFEPQDFLVACANALDVRIEGDATKLGGPVLVDPDRMLSLPEIKEMLGQELSARGFTTVQPPGSEALRLVPLADAASVARLETGDHTRSPAGFLRVLYPLFHRKPETAAEAVRPLLSKPAGSAQVIPERGALLIADLAPHVDQAITFLRRFDEPIEEPAILEIPLTHLSPAGMGALLERVTNARKLVTGEPARGAVLPLSDTRSLLVVAPEDEIGWWRDLVTRFDREEPATTVEYRPRRFGLAETARLVEEVVHGDPEPESHKLWRVVRDDLTGTLFVTTTPSRHEEVRAFLARLESTVAGTAQPMRAFVIKNRRVSEVLGLLQDLLDAGVLERTAPATGDPGAPIESKVLADGTGGPIAPMRSAAGVTLTADEGTNRVIAFGEARLLDQLGLLIKELDVRHAQVLIEALVVNLTESQTKELGVELQAAGTSGDALFQLGSLFGLGSASPSATTLPPLSGTGFAGAVLSPGDWSAVLKALQTTSRGRTLTVPKVLVQNNHQATLDSVLQTPYASTNASTTVATTSFGGTLDAGTTIAVKPQVADGERIVLEYTISLSSFVGASADPALPPPRKQDKLMSVVAIPDGYAVVVGGLEVEADTRGKSSVPILGDIPLLGWLFSDQSRIESKARLFVFLRCTAVKGESYEDMRFVSAPAIRAAGIDPGWPKLEPRVLR